MVVEIKDFSKFFCYITYEEVLISHYSIILRKLIKCDNSVYKPVLLITELIKVIFLCL